MGLLANILVKSNFPKSKFDVFDIRRSYSQNIQNMRKICLLGFSIQRLWGKLLNISRKVSFGPLLSKYDCMGAPISFWAKIYFFLAVINLFETKCSKWLNRIGNTGKTCKNLTFLILGRSIVYIDNMRNTLGRDIWAQIGRVKSGQAGGDHLWATTGLSGLLE